MFSGFSSLCRYFRGLQGSFGVLRVLVALRVFVVVKGLWSLKGSNVINAHTFCVDRQTDRQTQTNKQTFPNAIPSPLVKVISLMKVVQYM